VCAGTLLRAAQTAALGLIYFDDSVWEIVRICIFKTFEPRNSPVYLNASSRAARLDTSLVPGEMSFIVHNLLRSESSHKIGSVSVNRYPVRFFQLLDRQHKLACNASPWNLGKRKVVAANVPDSLFSTARHFVFFELKCVFPCLEKPKPAFYLENGLNVQSLPVSNGIHTAAAARASPPD
jgi:hypothetical protein